MYVAQWIAWIVTGTAIWLLGWHWAIYSLAYHEAKQDIRRYDSSHPRGLNQVRKEVPIACLTFIVWPVIFIACIVTDLIWPPIYVLLYAPFRWLGKIWTAAADYGINRAIFDYEERHPNTRRFE